jgi:omega-6 fatty acid desaturase (delta-12 desaturase)
MRTGQELILATKQYAKDITAKSWAYVLSTGFLLIAALVGTIWNFHPAAKVVCSVLSGLLILRMFVIYHDQQHHAILPHSKLAEAIMRLFGIYTMSPSSIWRSSHNHHHNHNSKLRGSHIGSFPIMTKAQFLKSSKGKRFGYLFVRHPLTILFGYIFMFVYGMCLHPFFSDPKRHIDSLIALTAHIALGIALFVYGGWEMLLLAQTIPHFIACTIGTYLFYAQHNFPGVTFKDNSGWTYEGAALESSSFMKTSPVMQWFTANIGYHHVHHLNSRIPFYRLPEVVAAMPELQNPKVTSLNPIEIARCLRLKVWDVESQQMISLRDVKDSENTGSDSEVEAGNPRLNQVRS